jgi:hypothetical protein
MRRLDLGQVVGGQHVQVGDVKNAQRTLAGGQHGDIDAAEYENA